MLQPSFHGPALAGFAEQITAATRARLAHWRLFAASGEPLDVASEMMRLTYTIAGRTLFSTEANSDAGTIEQAMQVILPHIWGRLGRLFNWPDWLATPSGRRFQAARRDIAHALDRDSPIEPHLY